MKHVNKRSIALLFTIFLVTIVTDAIAQKTNFSGKWVFNARKTELFSPGTFLEQFVVADKQDSISVKNVDKTDWDILYNRTLSYDGKASEVSMPEDENGIKRMSKRSVKRSEDGASIIITDYTTRDNNGEISNATITEVWILSEEGNELSIEKTEQGNEHAAITVKLVYSKK